MADVKHADVSGEDAARLTGLSETKHMEIMRRVNELEYSLVRARDALRVIGRSLEGLAEEYAGEDERRQGLTQDDVSLLFGAVSLLDNVACDCERTFNAEV